MSLYKEYADRFYRSTPPVFYLRERNQVTQMTHQINVVITLQLLFTQPKQPAVLMIIYVPGRACT